MRVLLHADELAGTLPILQFLALGPAIGFPEVIGPLTYALLPGLVAVIEWIVHHG
jgi:hypothetical protein